MDKNLSIIERILQILEYKSITKYKFCKDVGVSNGFLDKPREITTDKYAKILAYFPDVSPEWLLTGKGSMLNEYNKKIVSLSESENSKLVRDLIDKNERLSQRIGELVNENAHLRKNIMELHTEIDLLKKEMSNKNTQRNSVYSYPDIAAEPKDEE